MEELATLTWFPFTPQPPLWTRDSESKGEGPVLVLTGAG